MLALRWSFDRDLFLVAMLGLTTLTALTTPVAPRPAVDACPLAAGPAPIHGVRVSLLAPHAVRAAPHDPFRTACGAAEHRYQHRESARAAQTLRLAVHLDPALETTSGLYDQLQRAWDRAEVHEGPRLALASCDALGVRPSTARDRAR